MEAKRQEQLEAAAAASSERLLRKKDEVRVVAETQRRLEKARADLVLDATARAEAAAVVHEDALAAKRELEARKAAKRRDFEAGQAALRVEIEFELAAKVRQA